MAVTHLTITLLDGNQRSFERAVTIQEIAESISPKLAKQAIAGCMNGQLVDTVFLVSQDATVEIITKDHPKSLEILRHSTAHLLAHAVKELFPNTQVTIGPVIEDGFFYDLASEHTFTHEDLEQIEKRMHAIAARQLKVERQVIERDRAIEFFRSRGENYKAEIIQDLPGDEVISLYQQGDFVDLCRGPHVPDTSFLKVFKLLKIAGAYWRGDAKNAMLQRIYGTAFASQQDLDAYLKQVEEAEKRDHRKLAKAMDLFHTQEEAPGMIFWHPNGWIIYQMVESYIREIVNKHGYQEVHTPQVLDRRLWERSGHWDKFANEMFTTSSESHDFAIKPMNCPCHVQIFNQGLKSYRDLPIRLAEFGCCHRNESSGAIHGLMRTRSFVQDDAHIFCMEGQIQSEVARFMDLLFQVYATFGFHDVLIKLSTRPNERIGSDAIWDKAEEALKNALDQKGLVWQLAPGEGAFYGPKIEFSLKDSCNRIWQCGTMQVDFLMPERLGATYVSEENDRRVPVMLHRAILGSLERFIGILIEHYAGLLPLWLSPVHAVVTSISDRQVDYAAECAQYLLDQGCRVHPDLRNEKIGFKIREHTLHRVPYQIVVGDREVENRTISVRTYRGKQLNNVSLVAFVKDLVDEVESRRIPVLEEE
jgi:threonyl-tRNA synthetase